MTDIIETGVRMIEIASSIEHQTSFYLQPEGGEVKFFKDEFGSWFKFNRMAMNPDERAHVVMPVSRILSVEYEGYTLLTKENA